MSTTTAYPPPQSIPQEEMLLYLSKLCLPLQHLPSALPEKPLSGPDSSIYAIFPNYQPNPEAVEMTGTPGGVLNMFLEHFFGFRARITGDGILPIVERGPAVCAIHDVLLKHYTEAPDDNVLKKWIIDLLQGAGKAYITHEAPLPTFLNKATPVNVQASESVKVAAPTATTVPFQSIRQ
ncbi:hypothetical protein CPC08DRAFT_729358 [Agrocybe pediades]|nr:hypothetical protein CPC08DRAFT_729358 [Agrocybe pediades]